MKYVRDAQRSDFFDLNQPYYNKNISDLNSYSIIYFCCFPSFSLIFLNNGKLAKKQKKFKKAENL